ncbi:monocarboxylate transporter 2-like isoform X1 [Atheta coriaria]|uniref:monocarboxylate transporter 2-like isoform X1 n=1 Tax=Dalotia coriaria TaxID=877792 RepID=UPI0031F3F224
MEWNQDGFVPPDGGYGWIIVIAFVVINSCLLNLTQCFGIIYHSQYDVLGLTGAKVSFLLHLYNFIMCALGIISGPLLKRFDYRQVSFLGSFLMCLGTFLTAFSKSYEALLFTIGILIGTGQGILMPGMYIAVNSYFKKRLTLAISLQVTGASLSQIFMPQVCDWLVKNYGVHGAVLILAAISFNALPLTILLRPMGKKKSKSTNEKTDDTQHVSERLLSPVYQETTYRVTKNKRSRISEFARMLDLGLFGDRVYVIIVIGMGVSFASELNVILMMPFILRELSHFNQDNTANAMSVQAFADIIGRLAIPFIAYRQDVPPKIMYLLSLTLSCFGRTILSVFYEQPSLVFTVSAILGLAKGMKAVFQSVIIPKFVSREKLAAATGLSMVSNGILSLIIGPLIGWTHDISESYIYTLHVASVLSLFCIVLWTAEFLCTSRLRLKRVETVEVNEVNQENNVNTK